MPRRGRSCSTSWTSHGPDIAILCNLANATACVGLQQEAVAIARRAISLDPGAVLPRRALCNTLPYREATTGAALLAAMRDCSAVLPRVAQPPLGNNRDPDRKLVVGLLSGTLRSHPVGWLTVAGIETLDPDQFSLVCLAQNAAPGDPIARRYRTAARAWIEVDGLNDAALTAVAREQRIDILIDLGGYGDAARMPACANRLAPVQIKWVGMQAHSSGLAEMDWFLTDRWETPDGFEPLYSEKLLRLPDGYVCYSPPPHAPDVVALPALTNGFVTFGCFNNLAKITPRVIETWAEILRRIPDARLILKTHQLSDRPTADGFLADFASLGVDGGRIELRGSSGHRAFMGEYGACRYRAGPVSLFRRPDDVRGAVDGRADHYLAGGDFRVAPFRQPHEQCRAAGLGGRVDRGLHQYGRRAGGGFGCAGGAAGGAAGSGATKSAVRCASVRPRPGGGAAARLAGVVRRSVGRCPETGIDTAAEHLHAKRLRRMQPPRQRGNLRGQMANGHASR